MVVFCAELDKMTKPTTFAEYLASAGFGEGNDVGASSSSIAPPSVVFAEARVDQSLASAGQKDSKPNLESPGEKSRKRPPPSSPSVAKKLKTSQPVEGSAELSVEDFKAYLKVGELSQQLLTRWSTDVSFSEQGNNYSEAENLWLNGELQDKSNKLMACVEFLLEA